MQVINTHLPPVLGQDLELDALAIHRPLELHGQLGRLIASNAGFIYAYKREQRSRNEMMLKSGQ